MGEVRNRENNIVEKRELEQPVILKRDQAEKLMHQEVGSKAWKLQETSIETKEIEQEYHIKAQAVIPLETYKGHFKELPVVPFVRLAQVAVQSACLFETWRSHQDQTNLVFFLRQGRESKDVANKFIACPPLDKPVQVKGTMKKIEGEYVGDFIVLVADQGGQEEEVAKINGISCFSVPKQVLEDPSQYRDQYLPEERLHLIEFFQRRKPDLEFWNNKDIKAVDLEYLNYDQLTQDSSTGRPFFNVVEGIYSADTNSILTKAEFVPQDVEGRYQKVSIVDLVRIVPAAALTGEILVNYFGKRKGIIKRDSIPVANEVGNVEMLKTDKLIHTPCELIIEEQVQQIKGDNIVLNNNIFLDDIKIAKMENLRYQLVQKRQLNYFKKALTDPKSREARRFGRYLM